MPRVLDGLCDEVLSPYPGAHDHGYDSAQAIVDALEEYVGDLAAVAAAEAARRRGSTSPRIPRIDAPLALAPDASPGADPGAFRRATAPSRCRPWPRWPTAPRQRRRPRPTRADARARRAGPEETQVGVPVFDDITEGDWYSSRSEPVPPPPPFEETPERPLFAPDPPEGRAARVPRTPGAEGTGAGTGAGYWPWENDPPPPPPPDGQTEDDDDRVPGRTWLRTAALIALGLVILLASLFAFNRGRDQGASGEDGDSSASPSASSTAPAEPLGIASVADFDPFGDPPEENSERAPLAVDGKPGTAWTTSTYRQNFGPGGLKDGVGLLLDLGKAQDVGSVDLTLVDSPTSVQLLSGTGTRAPTAVDGLDVAAEGDAEGAKLTLTPDQPVRARWLVVWLTSVPDVGGFRGGIAEIVVRP